MKRTLALLCFLPIILGNSRCDPVYAILGFESAIDTAQEATTQTEIVGMGEEPTPFIAQSPTLQASTDDIECDIAGVSTFVGLNIADLLASDVEEQGWRIIYPGQKFTFDYRPERLNIHVDAEGLIDRLNCG